MRAIRTGRGEYNGEMYYVQNSCMGKVYITQNSEFCVNGEWVPESSVKFTTESLTKHAEDQKRVNEYFGAK